MSLNGLCVWVTRPQDQSGALCRLIRKNGGVAYALPTVVLQPMPLSQVLRSTWLHLVKPTLVIVLSANAVRFFSLPWQDMAQAIAIGPATAAALSHRGIDVFAVAQPASSEGLLALPMLQDVAGQQCFVLCGQDPRQLLHNRLKGRGADVTTIVSYRRVAPAWQDQQVLHFMQQQSIDVVVFTSMSGIKNLIEGLDFSALARLRQCCAVVVGKRMAKECQNGQWFAMIYVATDASDASIVAALKQCVHF